MTNSNLHLARATKDDEFYTRYGDIQREMEKYDFSYRIVYLNCNDADTSEFYRYFKTNFEKLRLWGLIATCLAEPRTFFNLDDGDRPRWVEYNGKEEKRYHMKGDGDFRSRECLDTLKGADIVISNPPFSLFREYIDTMVKSGKKFIAVGPITTGTSSKKVFPHIRSGAVRLGHSAKSGMSFTRPDGTSKKFGNIRWFTNMEHHRNNPSLELKETYTPEKYPHYDNYDAINVERVKDIPMDYNGLMGVPINYMDKHNPDQFEIVGCSKPGCHEGIPAFGDYRKYWRVRQDGTTLPNPLSNTTDDAVLEGNDGKRDYYTDGTREVQLKFARLFIRRR